MKSFYFSKRFYKLARFSASLALIASPLAAPPTIALAQHAPTGAPRDELPPQTIVQSQVFKTADDIFSAMGVTRDVFGGKNQAAAPYAVNRSGHLDGSTQAGAPFVLYPKIDLVDFETDMVQQFIDGRGFFSADPEPPSSRAVIVVRYGFDNKSAVDVMLHAKQAGLHSATLITDGPITMDAKKAHFASPTENFTNDIRPEYLTSEGNGHNVKQLLDAGYALSSPVHNPQTAPPDQIIQPGKYTVAMSALAHGLQMTPIMHEKKILMVVLKDPKAPLNESNIKSIYDVDGSGNWTHVHFNRDFLYKDDVRDAQGMARFALKHTLATLQTFTAPGSSAKIVDIPTQGRFRLLAQDGSFVEQAFTDGKFELNERIIDFLEEVAAHPEQYKIDEIVLSHFVSTNKRLFQGLFHAWSAMNKAGRPFRIKGILDRQYIDLEGFGVSSALQGLDARNVFGGFLKGFPEDFQKSVDLFANFEEVPGAQNIDPNGPPEHRILWHDKTTWIKWQKPNPAAGELSQFVDIWTGSYNASTNRNNLEAQYYLRVPRKSRFAAAVHDSVMSAVSDAVKRKVAVPLQRGSILTVLEKFVGQDALDLDPKLVDEFIHFARSTPAFDGATVNQLDDIFARLNQKPSRLTSQWQVSAQTRRERLTALQKFYAWTGQVGADQAPVRRDLNEILHLLLVTTQPSQVAANILDGFLRPKGANQETIDQNVIDALKAMGRTDAVAPQPPGGNRPRVPRVAAEPAAKPDVGGDNGAALSGVAPQALKCQSAFGEP